MMNLNLSQTALAILFAGLSVATAGCSASETGETGIRLYNRAESTAFWDAHPDKPGFSTRETVKQDAVAHSAIKADVYVGEGISGQLMELDGKAYFASTATYMPQSHPGETCSYLSEAESKRRGNFFLCAEGQIQHNACFLYFQDPLQYKILAIHRFEIADPKPGYPAFCMNTEGFGMGNKETGSVLVTVQYHDTHSKPAASPKDIGKGWMRTTRLLRIHEQDGKLSVEEDNRCLGQDNHYPDIPTARKALRQCPAALQ